MDDKKKTEKQEVESEKIDEYFRTAYELNEERRKTYRWRNLD